MGIMWRSLIAFPNLQRRICSMESVRTFHIMQSIQFYLRWRQKDVNHLIQTHISSPTCLSRHDALC